MRDDLKYQPPLEIQKANARVEQIRKAMMADPGSFVKTVAAEEIITDPLTGGQKGRKLARTDLLPADVLMLLAEHYGKGALKYADRNWEKGYAWSLSYGALLRHLFLWESGEDYDEETGSLHTVAAAWHAISLIAFQTRGVGTDDRP